MSSSSGRAFCLVRPAERIPTAVLKIPNPPLAGHPPGCTPTTNPKALAIRPIPGGAISGDQGRPQPVLGAGPDPRFLEQCRWPVPQAGGAYRSGSMDRKAIRMGHEAAGPIGLPRDANHGPTHRSRKDRRPAGIKHGREDLPEDSAESPRSERAATDRTHSGSATIGSPAASGSPRSLIAGPGIARWPTLRSRRPVGWAAMGFGRGRRRRG